jgi:hypothetical protein
LINRRQQGDLGEASAIEWLTRQGARVWTPLGHSPDADLIAELGERLLRVQVKTSTYRTRTPRSADRWYVQLATNGGNQSWNGLAKTLDVSRIDLLFVLVGDGRRWLIPADAIDANTGINLGGTKYSEFEIESAGPITGLVYGDDAALESDAPAGEYPSGQRTQTVNLSASSLRRFESCLPHPPPSSAEPPVRPRFEPSKYERKAGKNGEAVINQKRRVTLPQQALLAAGLRDGDWVRARADGPGRIVLEKIGLPVWAEPH